MAADQVEKIKLSNMEAFVKVDQVDFPRLNRFRWIGKFTRNRLYAYRYLEGSSHKTLVPLAQEVLGIVGDAGYRVKFLSEDTLDCRRENLEKAPIHTRRVQR